MKHQKAKLYIWFNLWYSFGKGLTTIEDKKTYRQIDSLWREFLEKEKMEDLQKTIEWVLLDF